MQRAADRLGTVLIAGRVWLLAGAHTILFTIVLWFSFWVRFDFQLHAVSWKDLQATLPWVLLIKLSIFAVMGQFHGWWRFVTFGDLIALGRGCLICLAALATANLFLFGTVAGMPRSIVLLDTVFTLILIGSLRCTWRLFRECLLPAMNPGIYCPTLLIGIDDETALLANQIQSFGQTPYRVRGFVSLNGAKHNGHLGRLPILGSLDDLAGITTKHDVKTVLVIAGHMPGNSLRELMQKCTEAELELKIVPPVRDRLRGGDDLPVRDINIEDLLGREPVQLDERAIQSLIQGKRVLVTGAGGSIGSEICRQVLKFQPESLVLLGRGENRIFVIERELRDVLSNGLDQVTHESIAKDSGASTSETNGSQTNSAAEQRALGHQVPSLIPVIADIRDTARVRQIFEDHRPEVVFHAAAHKHVPLMEANVCEAVKNNVLGTRVVADAAHESGVSHFVLISSDKAVRPSSVMGATKQIAESYVQAYASDSETKFMAVRFGNVLGSAGSVVPIFQDQIRRGGPITLTDPRMERYFMTIPEASQLVLQSAAMGRGGEIFVLEMGEPVKIANLAQDMIQLSGLPADSIEIVHLGIRQGEKLSEELALDPDQTCETDHPKVQSVYQSPLSLAEIRNQITVLESGLGQPDSDLKTSVLNLVELHALPTVA